MVNGKQFCAICSDRAVGTTECVRLGHGVELFLCGVHASVGFQTRRDGEEFVEVLTRLWTAHGCLTLARRKALAGHLRTLETARRSRRKPGSYAWADLRGKVEAAFARGVHPNAIHAYLERNLESGLANRPSLRTLRRWHAERRWIAAG